VPNFGESILGVKGPKPKIAEQRFVECHMENRRPKKMARFHEETKKKNRFKGTSRAIGDITPNFVAMATKVGATTFCMVPLNRPSPKTP